MTGSLIPEGLFDEHKIGRGPAWDNLPGRSNAEEQTTAADKKLLGEQDCERATDGAANNAQGHSTELELVERRMITGPSQVTLRLVIPQQMGNDVSVRVKDADLGDISSRQRLLASCLP